jgi:ADP-ribose pyrophosphatase YjhB (NUDIX family)
VPNNPRKIGAAAIVMRDGAVLLECRSDDGSWALPGGTLEENETLLQAVARELREETGLEAMSATLFGVFSDPSRVIAYLDGNVYRLLTVVFRVETAAGEPAASEESLEVRFVPLSELGRVEVTPVHRPVIEALLAEPSDVVVA